MLEEQYVWEGPEGKERTLLEDSVEPDEEVSREIRRLGRGDPNRMDVDGEEIKVTGKESPRAAEGAGSDCPNSWGIYLCYCSQTLPEFHCSQPFIQKAGS